MSCSIKGYTAVASGVALLAVFTVSGCGGGEVRDSASSGPTGTGISSASASASASASGGETGTAEGEDNETGPTTGPDDEGMMTDPVKFDVSKVPDAAGQACGGGGGGDGGELSYIWIANSSQNTISKINTKTIIEEGRYWTRPDQNGSPSRTSVNLGGDVAVANRIGGLTKVIAVTDNCDPMNNGVPGLQTSSGANDILGWGQDDCIAWHTPLNYSANRPAAWTFGTLNLGSCKYENTKFWTAASNGSGANAHAMRLNGDTGAIEDDVLLAGFQVNGYGPYGGAVDPDENFWTIAHSSGYLARVDGGDLTVSVWVSNVSAYGFTIDEFGRPWIGGLSGQTAVFDPETEQFTYLNGGGLGMGQAANGIMWQATHPSQTAVRGWDINTLQIVKEIPLPVSSTRGVSVDIDGYVWFVEVGNRAFKIDAVAETYEVYDQLVGAYTYSDMTGNALSLVAGGPAG